MLCPLLPLRTSPHPCHLQTAVADAAFRVFLARALRQGRSAARDACLRDHALCFLAHTGHRYPRVRGVAYRHLVELLERFPHLLWDEAWCVLAFVERMAGSDEAVEPALGVRMC
jgi:hypothetical protein